MGKKPVGRIIGDKMTIVGADGKARFEVQGDLVRDMRYCACDRTAEDIPILAIGDIHNGEGQCAKCKLPIAPTLTS